MKHFLKRIYLALFLLLHISGVTFSQNPTTCRGSGITTEPAYEVTPAEIAQFDAEWLAYAQTLGLSEADKLAPSSAAYNCHGYAWHMREGNANPVWINNASGTLPNGCHGESHTIDKYWTDGCFIAVCLERDADKVHYYCGDHSAVASIAAPGKLESKWGKWPVVRHTLGQTPYSLNGIQYYASTKITANASGPLCTNATRIFTVKNIWGATYNWTVSTGLTIQNGVGTNQITVIPNAGFTGNVWVSVTIGTGCSTTGATPARQEFAVSNCSVQGTNLALNRAVVASTTRNSYVPSAAVDGNGSTRWSSQFSDPQWIYVDLGSAKTISAIKLRWENAYGRSYRIETSNNSSGPWAPIYSTTSGDGGIDEFSVNGSGRYVRMYGTQRGTTFGYSLWEFEIYGSSSTPPLQPMELQAEEALLSGPVIAREWANYNGSGYADYVNSSNDFIEWTANIPEAGNYNLIFRYAASTARSLQLKIDGNILVASSTFPSTTTFANWQIHTVPASFTVGVHKIRATAIGSSGPNIDQLSIVKNSNTSARIAIYPNPAQDELNIEAFEDEDQNAKMNSSPNSFNAKIFDKNSLVRATSKRQERKLTIDTSTLPEGLYYLQIERNGKITRERIIVKH